MQNRGKLAVVIIRLNEGRIIMHALTVLSQESSSYREDDRAMHPMYGCHENFRESLTIRTPTATFREIFNGLFSDWSLSL